MVLVDVIERKVLDDADAVLVRLPDQGSERAAASNAGLDLARADRPVAVVAGTLVHAIGLRVGAGRIFGKRSQPQDADPQIVKGPIANCLADSVQIAAMPVAARVD